MHSSTRYRKRRRGKDGIVGDSPVCSSDDPRICPDSELIPGDFELYNLPSPMPYTTKYTRIAAMAGSASEVSPSAAASIQPGADE